MYFPYSKQVVVAAKLFIVDPENLKFNFRKKNDNQRIRKATICAGHYLSVNFEEFNIK